MGIEETTKNEKLTQIDLFSGIGGFSLAAGWAGFKTIAFCENEPYCQEVLKLRFGGYVADSEPTGLEGRSWDGKDKRRESVSGKRHDRDKVGGEVRRSCRGDIPIISDIRDFDGSRFRGAALLTGGFPCQPFSVAGKRGGKEDDRYLWPEMLRVIQEARPTWVVGENVPGIVNVALEQVCLDLEAENYEVQPLIIPASAVNAPHQRKRVWIIAHAGREYGERTEEQGKHGRALPGEGTAPLPERPAENGGIRDAPDPEPQGDEWRNPNKMGEAWGEVLWPSGNIGHAPDSKSRGTGEPAEPEGGQDIIGGSEKGGDAPDTENPDGGWDEETENDSGRRRSEVRGQAGENWDIPWIEVATRFCRVDDGLPAWVYRHRVKRLKALGNAIVPQVAYEILKGIAEIENSMGIKKEREKT